MAETVYLIQRIKDMLTNTVFSTKETSLLLLGDRVSQKEIYVVNTTVPFEGQETSTSIDKIPGFDMIIRVVRDANTIIKQQNHSDEDKYILFFAHSHPQLLGQIVQPGYDAWSVNEVPPDYEASRGSTLREFDRDGNLLYFSLARDSTNRGGDDIALEKYAKEFGITYTFFVRPPSHLVYLPMRREVAIDCYKYDPRAKIGKIRKIQISPQILGSQELLRTLLDPNKYIFESDQKGGHIVLPFRRRPNKT